MGKLVKIGNDTFIMPIFLFKDIYCVSGILLCKCDVVGLLRPRFVRSGMETHFVC